MDIEVRDTAMCEAGEACRSAVHGAGRRHQIRTKRDDKTEEALYMRIMGLDFGSKTVGVALSDPLLITAQGLEIIRRKDENKLRQTLARIETIIEENQVEEIVLGLPKNMNDTEGVRVELTLEFKDKLERRTGLEVHLWDERLTTVAADRAMMEAGIRRENRKDYVDMIAATLILQGFLDKRAMQNEDSAKAGDRKED